MFSKSRMFAVILVIISGAVIVGFVVLGSSPLSCAGGDSSSIIHFTITESALGYNDSKDHYPSAWPIMTVHLGQLVCLHIQNIDSSEAHGFMMDKYVVSERVLQPGTSIDVSFIATQAGTFTFRCTIPCVVHQYMLNGKLIVTS